MHDDVNIRVARSTDAPHVADILAEAAVWADRLGAKLWQLDELDPRRLAEEVTRGLFFLAWRGKDSAGTVKFQLDDPVFWPDEPGPHAAYIHRLAVRRRYAGGVTSGALMAWAVTQARAAGRRVLRLDCDAERVSLRGMYERFGFAYHSDRQVGPYLVARYEYRIGAEGRGVDPSSGGR